VEDDKVGRQKGVGCAAGDDIVECCAERGVGRECKGHFIEELVEEQEAAEAGVGGEQFGNKVYVDAWKQVVLGGECVYLGDDEEEGQSGAGNAHAREHQGMRQLQGAAVAHEG
jgi:hypothetical protein